MAAGMREIQPAALETRLPEAFCERMHSVMPEEEYRTFLSSYGQKRFFSLRVNPLKCSREKFLGLAARQTGQGESLCLRQVPWEPDGFYYPETFTPGRLPWHEAGMYYIQEASAMVPAMLCGARPGECVLDLCAAPGGKSTKLAACMQGEGLLVANEIHPERAKVLSANLERMGVRNALVTNETPQRLASRFPYFFDRIVVDAPCSGEGMFRKEEEALLHWSPGNVRMCAERQTEILEEASVMLCPGGILVYSTCTFSPEENEGVILRFLREHPDFSMVGIPDMPGIRAAEWGFAAGKPEWIPGAGIDADEYGAGVPVEAVMESIRGAVRLWPHLLDGEGHFAAVLRKDGVKDEAKDRVYGNKRYTVEKRKEKRKNRGKGGGKRQAEDPAEKEILRMWEEFCRENLLSGEAPDAVTSLGRENLFLFGSTLYGLPVPASRLSTDGLRVLRAGLQLGALVRGRFEPSHSLAMALRPEEVRRFLDFGGDSPQAYAWLRGESVSVGENAEKGWTLVQIDGCSAGWGKVNGGVLKNHYPRGLRKGSGYKAPG